MKTVSRVNLLERGYSIKNMPRRGYALRTIDNTLFIFRLVDNSVWSEMVRSIIKSFNADRHMDLVICNVELV